MDQETRHEQEEAAVLANTHSTDLVSNACSLWSAKGAILSPGNYQQ